MSVTNPNCIHLARPRQAAKAETAGYNGAMFPAHARLLRVVEANRHAGLRLLVLFGSRARGDAAPGADWDLAFLADSGFDPDALMADLALGLASDDIDLVDLSRAGAQVRFRVARDGLIVHEAMPGEFGRFWVDAVSFWCDAAPVLERAYEGVLSRLS